MSLPNSFGPPLEVGRLTQSRSHSVTGVRGMLDRCMVGTLVRRVYLATARGDPLRNPAIHLRAAIKELHVY